MNGVTLKTSNIIKNCEPYYDGLFDNNSLVSKAFVDAEIAKIPQKIARNREMIREQIIWSRFSADQSVRAARDHQVQCVTGNMSGLIYVLF